MTCAPRHNPQIVTGLDRLEKQLPQIIREHPHDGAFWIAFSRQADDIEHAAGPNDWRYVHERIDAMLRAVGIIPHE
ncbi:MAG: hypothetical protein ABIR62_01055 [Dokdonella sp.]|uniref:hypothetical protein n=1 Tax=Dokdonella sp. TaxID=2291710 RepID=UPI00326692F8